MAALIEAIEIKRKSYFEYENAPYHCLDVEVSKPTARGGQTLVRLKMRNLLTRAVFDKTFKAGDRFGEPDLVMSPTTFTYSDADGFHFMGPDTFEPHTLSADILGEDRGCLWTTSKCRFTATRAADRHRVPAHVELTVTNTEMGLRGNTASGSVTKTRCSRPASRSRCPVIKEGEKVKVHTETREFAAALNRPAVFDRLKSQEQAERKSRVGDASSDQTNRRILRQAAQVPDVEAHADGGRQ